MNFPKFLILSAFNGAIWSASLGALARWQSWHWMPSPVALWIGISGATLLALIVISRVAKDDKHPTVNLIIWFRDYNGE